MFDGRIYRAAFVPLLFALVITGFTLTPRASPLSSTFAPDAFDGTSAFAGLQTLAKRFPSRRPGSAGDDALATYIAQTLRGLGNPPNPSSGEADPATTSAGTSASSTAGSGFQVSTDQIHAQTIDGARTLTTVIAQRPGSSGESPIAIVAHRDAAGRDAAAELSGTAALLELARVLSQSETRRAIVLVSTSGGSGGYAGAADFAQHGVRPLDAAVVLGDLAGEVARKPFVLPYSSTSDAAPESLQLTLDGAITQEVGASSPTPGVLAQLTHLAVPLAIGEQAPFNATEVPAVMVQVSGARGPTPGEGVSEARLQNFGSAVLSAVYALDEGADVSAPSTPRLLLGRNALPNWAVRLLVLTLLLPPLLTGIDALARLRRRREPVLRWITWTLIAALPFFAAALFASLLGALAIVAAPSAQLSAGSLAADSSATAAVLSTVLVLVLALLTRPLLTRRAALPRSPATDGAGLAVLLVLLAVALLAWLFNPFACLLLVPALHLWLYAVAPTRQSDARSRTLALGAILGGVLPLALLLIVYAHELALSPARLAQSIVLALAGGQVGLLGALMWSAALGCLLAALLRVLARTPTDAPSDAVGPGEWTELSTRGPVSYAGPGSLGGTESALQRQ
jgi:hypothetical protein